MRDDEFNSWVSIAFCLIILGMALYFGTGCATAPPNLNITEKQVDEKIQELMNKPTTKEGVKYDSENDWYVVDPATARILANDEIRLHIYEEEILPDVQEYLAENPPANLGMKARWAGIGVIAGIILSVIGVVAIGGL